MNQPRTPEQSSESNHPPEITIERFNPIHGQVELELSRIESYLGLSLFVTKGNLPKNLNLMRAFLKLILETEPDNNTAPPTSSELSEYVTSQYPYILNNGYNTATSILSAKMVKILKNEGLTNWGTSLFMAKNNLCISESK